MAVVTKAETVWRHLNGICCIYKPSGVTLGRVRNNLLLKLCEGLNEMEVREPINRVNFVEYPNKGLTVKVEPSYADNTLVVGPRYQVQDIPSMFSTPLGIDTSGVLVFGINKGNALCRRFDESNPIRVYHVKGILGQITDNFHVSGKIIGKAKSDHVTKPILDRVLASFEAAHQKQMFIQAGIDMRSQAAYETAIAGLPRPQKRDVPVIYSLKCFHFEPPYFEFEVSAISTRENYLHFLVKEIGLKLRTLATCAAVRCIRHGPFTVNHSLLQKHWTLRNILLNMKQSQDILLQSSPKLIEYTTHLQEKTSIQIL